MVDKGILTRIKMAAFTAPLWGATDQFNRSPRVSSAKADCTLVYSRSIHP